jgi:hypothetical protein
MEFELDYELQSGQKIRIRAEGHSEDRDWDIISPRMVKLTRPDIWEIDDAVEKEFLAREENNRIENEAFKAGY